MSETSKPTKMRDDAEIMRFVRTYYPSLTTQVQEALVRNGRFADHLRRSFSREMDQER